MLDRMLFPVGCVISCAVWAAQAVKPRCINLRAVLLRRDLDDLDRRRRSVRLAVGRTGLLRRLSPPLAAPPPEEQRANA